MEDFRSGLKSERFGDASNIPDASQETRCDSWKFQLNSSPLEVLSGDSPPNYSFRMLGRRLCSGYHRIHTLIRND